MLALKDHFKGRGYGDPWGREPRWNDPLFPDGMDWSIVEDELFLIPYSDEFRKPKQRPFTQAALSLFKEALSLASQEGCKAIYQGETRGEVEAAAEVGLETHLVRFDPRGSILPTEHPEEIFIQPEGFFMSFERIEEIAQQ